MDLETHRRREGNIGERQPLLGNAGLSDDGRRASPRRAPLWAIAS
jgi:hypothetical protein